jgi:triacylglycerol lipase
VFFFEPQAIAYSPVNAVALAQAARLAYCDSFKIASTTKTWNFPRYQFFDRNHTQAFIMGNDEVIILAFRGTEGNCLKDWMTDVDIKLVRSEHGQVHCGFNRSLEIIWLDLLMLIQNFRTHKQSLFITGHSLGGALATLAAAKLQAFGYPVQGLYTFGSPRVGDREFYAHFSQVFPTTAFRFVNNNDIVTRIPPRSFGYKHVGQCLFFDAEGSLHFEIDAWNKFLDHVKGGMEQFLNDCGFVGDHDMAKYESNLVFNMADRHQETSHSTTVAA